MASSVVFNNARIFQPGAYSRVDASALELAQDFAPNVVCVIGAALGGKPMTTYAFNNANQAQQVFGPGSPLADAITFAFRGGAKGGAPVVLGIRADDAAQSSGTLTAANGTSLKATHDDYGGYTNTYSVSFLAGSTVGVQAVVEGKYIDGDDYKTTIDNEPSFSNLLQRISDTTPVTMEILAGGTKATQTLTIATSTDDGKAVVADEGGTNVTTEGYFYQYPASFLANTTDSLVLAFDATISWTATLDAGTDTITATGAGLADGTPVTFAGDAIGNLTAGTVYYVVSADGDDFSVASTSGGSAIDITGSFTNATVTRAFGSTTVSSALPATVEGTYDTVTVTDAYNNAVTNVGVTLTAYGSNIYRFTLAGGDTWGYDSGQGLIGSIFEISGGDYAGTYQILHHEWDGTSDDEIRTVQKLTAGSLSAGTIASATLAFWPSVSLDPTTQPATTALETQLPADGVLYRGGQYLTITLDDPDRNAGALQVQYTTQPGDTIEVVGQELASLINENADWQDYVAAAAAYNGGTYTSTITLTAVTPGQLANAWQPNILVNTQTTVLVARGGTLLTGGIDPDPPRDAQGNITGSITMASGFDSVPILQRWLEALEVIRYTPLRYLIPAGTDNAGVQAAFVAHCVEQSSTPKRYERIAIMGHNLGWTMDEVKTRAESFNSERAVFVSPGLQMADLVTGNIRMYSSAHATVGIVAGMLAAEGNGVSDPITHTFLSNVFSTELNYQPSSLELDEAIASGVLTIEKDPTLVRESRGYRVTRGITTMRSSVTFEEISVLNQSDYVAQVLRDMEETLFIGKAIDSTTLALVKDAVNRTLNRLTGLGIIYGYDPQATVATINPSNQSAIDVTVDVSPRPALNFVLNSILLTPISAADVTGNAA